MAFGLRGNRLGFTQQTYGKWRTIPNKKAIFLAFHVLSSDFHKRTIGYTMGNDVPDMKITIVILEVTKSSVTSD